MIELITLLLPALARVESNNNPNAVGDNGKAIGTYQIHKIYVDDVNRILGEKVFAYRDRKNQALASHMVIEYLTYYGKRYEKQTGKKATLEVLARIQNGGPNGWKKKATLKYWQKVKKELDKQ